MAAFFKDRRRAQAGTTLVELLVAVTIIGIALVLIIGTFSTGLLDATVAKRNTSAQAVIQSELDHIAGTPYAAGAQPYSACFKTESTDPPVYLAYQASCPDSSYSLRADVSVVLQQPTATTQTWTVAVVTWPDLVGAGSAVSTVKDNR